MGIECVVKLGAIHEKERDARMILLAETEFAVSSLLSLYLFSVCENFSHRFISPFPVPLCAISPRLRSPLSSAEENASVASRLVFPLFPRSLTYTQHAFSLSLLLAAKIVNSSSELHQASTEGTIGFKVLLQVPLSSIFSRSRYSTPPFSLRVDETLFAHRSSYVKLSIVTL